MLNDLKVRYALRAAFMVPALILASDTGLVSTAYAQDQTPMSLAEDALQGINPTDSVSEGNLDVVEPFETTSPPEAGLTNATIDNEVTDRRARGDSIEARVHRELEDSAASRPEFPDVDQDPALIGRTEAITNAAPQVMADLFSTDGEGICEVDDFEGTPLIDAYCERSQAYQERSCSEDLEVTLDRVDNWRCIQIPEVYPQSCHQELDVQCNNPPNCLIASSNMTVNASERATDFPFQGNFYSGDRRSQFTTNEYKPFVNGNSIRLHHILHAGSQSGNVWANPSPFRAVTRTITFTPPPTGVNYTNIEMDIYWEAFIPASNYTVPDCKPDVIINGAHKILDGNLLPYFRHSTPQPCLLAGSALLHNQSRPLTSRFSIQKRTFNLTPFLALTGELKIDVIANGRGARGIITDFRFEGGCCIDPDITYENLSCE